MIEAPDITGQSFGHATAVRYLGADNGAVWECLCSCGKIFQRKAGALRRNLKRGFKTSCGCNIGNPSKVIDGQKLCPRCNSMKAISSFSKNSAYTSGRQSYCRLCSASWRSSNMEYVKRSRTDYAKRNAAAIKARSKAYNAKNSKAISEKTTKWAKENPERRKKIANAWVRRNPAYGRYHSNLRRANKIQATPTWANLDLIKAIYAKAKRCGLTVDHIVPLVSKIVCGLHCEQNMQLLTFEDNLAKSNRVWPDMP